MRLSTVGLAALRLAFALAAILLFSFNTLAQHSAGGGGGSAGASASSGGGSHGGSSGGSVSSGSSAGHSSGASVSHSSSAHTSTSGSASSRSGVRGTQSNPSHSIHQASAAVPGEAAASPKRSFFSLLRHPVRKPLPLEATTTPTADLRRPVCVKGPCEVCPKGGCAGKVITNNVSSVHRRCGAGEFRNGGACLQRTFLDDCSALRMMMERQAQQAQETEAARQSACSTDPQQCSASTRSAESEASLYRDLQARYQACQRRGPTAVPFNSFAARSYLAFSFESVR